MVVLFHIVVRYSIGFFVVIVIFFMLHRMYLNKAVTLQKTNKLYKLLPLIIIVLTVTGHIGMKSLHISIIGSQKGLKTVLNLGRFQQNIGYGGMEYGNLIDPWYHFNFVNYGDETKQFRVRLVEVNN